MPRRSYATHKFQKPVIPEDEALADYGETNAVRKANVEACDELLARLTKYHGEDHDQPAR